MSVIDKKFEIPLEKRKQIAIFIDAVRRLKIISINELSRKSGVHIYELHRILKSERNKINPFHLIALSKVLEINYLWLFQIVGYIDEKNILREMKGVFEKLEEIKINIQKEDDLLETCDLMSEEIIETCEDFEKNGYPEDLRILLGYPEEFGEEYKRKQRIEKYEKKKKKLDKELEKIDKELEELDKG